MSFWLERERWVTFLLQMRLGGDSLARTGAGLGGAAGAAGWGELEITPNTGLSGRGFQGLGSLPFGW